MYRIGKEEADAATRVIMSGSLFRIGSKYEEVNHFEHEWKTKIGSAHCLCLTSGTAALQTGLAALGVGPGDEVIIPAYTFISTAVAVLAVGAIPVIADIDDTLTLDPADVERKLSKYTKAVIPVHIAGFPCDMDRLVEMSVKHGFFLIEDACQADGGSYKGKRLGSIGDTGAFSFNWFKIISAGEGGAFVTNDLKIFERAIIYHDCGTPFWTYDQAIEVPIFSGFNMRSNEITGAVLREQVKRLDGILGDLRHAKKAIMKGLEGKVKFNPSNDPEGDCGTTLAFQFDTVDEAIAFETKIGGLRPINTNKHVYCNWTPVLEKRGAHVNAYDPFQNPQNAGLNMNYTPDMCKTSLDILSRSVYFPVNPDWTKEQIREKIELFGK
jgi:dTDP-4-amino-4,6-dideoxygalactose transaminase